VLNAISTRYLKSNDRGIGQDDVEAVEEKGWSEEV
jgi:hypothetical protein